nr:homoserine O-acetyltransferase [bacterium]
YNEQPVKGLGLARWIAMISYRSQKSYQDKFARGGQPCDQINPDFFYSDETAQPFAIEHYLDYQGKKLTARFDALSYIRITQAMDRHDVTEGRGSLDYVLRSIRAKSLCIGIRSDVLYPAEEQKAIARGIKNARYIELDSDDGHDAFLIKNELMNETIAKFLKENE